MRSLSRSGAGSVDTGLSANPMSSMSLSLNRCNSAQAITQNNTWHHSSAPCIQHTGIMWWVWGSVLIQHIKGHSIDVELKQGSWNCALANCYDQPHSDRIAHRQMNHYETHLQSHSSLTPYILYIQKANFDMVRVINSCSWHTHNVTYSMVSNLGLFTLCLLVEMLQ